MSLPIDSNLYLLLNLHCLLGGIAAVIAWRKGHSLGLWLLLGLVCGIAAFIVALLMKRKETL
jgi:O-antigen ligase